ncbi:MAG: IS110 family transposase [Calditrichia bacterium]|nr:IS110 family transposase [Calditrichia bacterium]
MRFYTEQHPYYCGIDLHTKNMYICILDQAGKILVHKNISTSPQALLRIIEPFLPDIAITVECIFTWYWIADLCREENIPFILGHALYMKAIHGAKTKNDKIDSRKIAVLLRGGMIPMAYVYPVEMRSTRDLLRRRMHFMYKRSELLSHIQNTRSQYNLPEFNKCISRKRNRAGISEQFEDVSVRKSIELNLTLIKQYDILLNDVELYLTRHAKEHDPNNLYLLHTIPGVGKILAMVLLYEINDINRFERVQNFTSYSRLIKPQKTSAGKVTGSGNRKIGNAYLKWAFSEATLLLIREKQEIKDFHLKLKNKHGKARALAIISHKIGRAVYYMLKNKQAFNMQHFLKIKDRAA